MNRKYVVSLNEEERAQLRQIVSSGTAPARQIRWAYILLQSDSSPEGPNRSDPQICAAFGVSGVTVTHVRKAYCQGGVEAAVYRKKPNREYPRRLDGEAEARLIALACSSPPEGHERWSLWLLRDRFDVHPPLPMEPGQPCREDYEYERNGVCNIFLFFEPLAGKRYVWINEHRTRVDWAEAMRYLADECYPDAEFIVVVMDNLNTHGPASFYEAFDPAEAHRLRERLEFHYTPKHGSWLNMAEIELSALVRT